MKTPRAHPFSPYLTAQSSNARSGKSRTIVENRGVGTVDDVSPDGKYVLVNRVASRGDHDVFRVDVITGKEILVTSRKTPNRVRSALIVKFFEKHLKP